MSPLFDEVTHLICILTLLLTASTAKMRGEMSSSMMWRKFTKKSGHLVKKNSMTLKKS